MQKRERERFSFGNLDVIPDAVIIVDKTGKIVQANVQAEKFFGYTRQEMLGQTVELLIPERFRSLHTEERAVYAASPRTRPMGTLTSIIRARRKDGTEFPVDIALSPIETNEGLLIMAVIRDMTEHARLRRFTENILATVPSCLVAIGKKSEVLSVNRSFCELFGMKKEDVEGQPVASVLHRIGLSQKCRVAIAERMLFRNLECACFIPGKGELTLNLTLSGMRVAEEEEEEEALLVIDDITERKRAEEGLLKIDTAIEQTADCVIITDRDGIIQYVNPAFTKNTGYSKEDAVGKTPRILKSGLHSTEFYKKIWDTILSGDVFRETFINKRKNSELFYELKTITPIKDKKGNITHFVSTAKDITEQKRIEQEIIFQKNKFAQLFENSPVAIALLDNQAKVININESFSALFGYYLEEIEGKSINDYIVPDELKEEAKLYTDQTREGSQINKEGYRKKKDGTLVFVNVVGISIIINEKLVGIYGMYIDLTYRKEAEEKMRLAKELAEQSNKFKDAFIANMSHEIRTPLNGILGMTSLIKDIYAQHIKEEDEELFFGIDDSSKRIIRTIDMILNYSRLQTGELPVSPEAIELSSICERLVREFQTAAKSKSLKLLFENRCKYSTILADEYSITQAISNLLDNAIKYTKEGFVKVILYKGGNDEIVIDVKDTGIAIAEDYLNEIFEPYIQEDMGYGRAYEGVGLGLPLVKKFLHLNNAGISIESKKGEGTTFTINFGKVIKPARNLSDDKARETVSKEESVSVVEPLEIEKDRSVLLVENDPLNQATIKRFLRNRYNTLITDSSDEVIEILRKNKIDIILMDISIDGIKNGLELTKDLKASKESSQIPIIVITAHAFENDRKNAFEAGCDEYLSKPFTKELLLDTIAKFV